MTVALVCALANSASLLRERQASDRKLEQESVAQWLEWRHSPSALDPYFLSAQEQYAVLPPAPLSLLCAGNSDLYRPAGKVYAWSTPASLFAQGELRNPTNLRADTFDLAFVMIYLLPLFIIALNFDLLSGEREGGTLALKLSQPVRVLQVLLAKMLIRAAVVFLLMMCAVGAGWAMLAGGSGFSLLVWTAAVCLYGAFWIALSLAVNSFGFSSSTNALVLAGGWILLTAVIPIVIDSVVQVRLPLSPRSEMILAGEEAELNYSRERQTALERMWHEHPEYRAASGMPSNARRAGLAAAFLLGQPVLEALEQRRRDVLRRRDEAVTNLQWLSPAVALQLALADLSGTGPARYRDFRRQVDEFVHEQRRVYFPMVFRGEKLTAAGYDTPLRFRYEEESLGAVMRRVLVSAAVMASYLFVCVTVAVWRMGGYQIHHA